MASDEAMRTKYFSRVKQITSNQEQIVHQKYMKRVKVIWNGRIMITLNNDPVSRRVLVPLDPSTQMKYNYYRGFQWEGYTKEETTRPIPWVWESQAEIERLIAAELPFFLGWLLAWKRPDWIKPNSRYGIESFQNEEMLSATVGQSAEFWTLHYIKEWLNEYFQSSKAAEWSGNLPELYSALNCDYCFDNAFKQIKTSQFQKHVDRLMRSSRLDKWGTTFDSATQEFVFKRPADVKPREELPPTGQLRVSNA